MSIEPYWINAQLAIVPRPQGRDLLDDEMVALRHAGIDIVISMLEQTEAHELGLEKEGAAATRAGMEFVNFPIQDRGVPNLQEFNYLLAELERSIAASKRIGVHCRGCIGRSSVVLASLLIRSGKSTSGAWKQIEAARGSPVPDTLEQLEWVERHMRPTP